MQVGLQIITHRLTSGLCSKGVQYVGEKLLLGAVSLKMEPEFARMVLVLPRNRISNRSSLRSVHALPKVRITVASLLNAYRILYSPMVMANGIELYALALLQSVV